jgi:ribonuclease-3
MQAERMSPAAYRVVDEKGPEHQKTFTVEVSAGAQWNARGRGASKKAAEQQAAQALLKNMEGKPQIDG